MSGREQSTVINGKGWVGHIRERGSAAGARTVTGAAGRAYRVLISRQPESISCNEKHTFPRRYTHARI